MGANLEKREIERECVSVSKQCVLPSREYYCLFLFSKKKEIGINRRYDMGKYCGNHWQFMIGKVFRETKKEAFIDWPKISRVSRVTMCQYTLGIIDETMEIQFYKVQNSCLP